MLTRLRDAHRDERGMTLVELMVGMTMAFLVTAFMTSWFVGAYDSASATSSSSQATADARNTLQAWSRMLQVGSSPTTAGSGTGRITALTPSSITFTANLGSTATCAASGACPALTNSTVTLAITGASKGNLTEQLGTQNTSVDLPGLITSTGSVTASAPYGNCLFNADVAGTAVGCTNLSTAQLASVTGVTLTFAVTTRAGHPQWFSTTVAFTTSTSGS